MHHQRILTLSDAKANGECVVYVMGRDQRVRDNHALIAAQQAALEQKLPLLVVFFLFHKVGERAYEHAEFMLKGLEEVASDLQKRNIPFVIQTDSDQEKQLKALTPAAVYFDFSPLNGPRKRAKALAKMLDCAVYVVDTHNIIPTWVASDKQEVAAYTFRTKVHKQLQDFLEAPEKIHKHPHSLTKLPKSISFAEAYKAIEHYPKRDINLAFESGESAAHEALKDFIDDELARYATERNNIAVDHQSNLSPYLHFGQLSSLQVALEVIQHVDEEPLLFRQAKMAQASGAASKVDGMNTLFEEMIVRKELSDNFCFYGKSYKSLKGAPEWAQQTLANHTNDPREHDYSLKQLEEAKTEDEAWNAAQLELIHHGKIHGYMRMYWAKKILEWTDTPEKALAHAIHLNDAYSIDGGDPNGYVGILWAIAGLHDRPWTERSVFGKVRYMNYGGLKRKFDVEAYIERANQ